MSTQPYALYNPALLEPEVLLAEFTARHKLLQRLVEIVRANAPGHPPQHVVLLGARGMGKTTMLWALAHTISLHEPKLLFQWQPVVFDEESRRVGDLADFWLECIRQWELATRAGTHCADELLNDPNPDIEDRARDTFLAMVDASGRRALLLIDNINEIFRSIRDPDPLHRLRALLMEDDRVMIVGASTSWFDDITSLDKPFFEFFRTFELKALDFNETIDCLTHLADARGDASVKTTIEKRAGSLRAMHLLTGGNPRLVKTFYRLLRDGLHHDIRIELEQLLDEFTPYFKALVDSLPVQQQRIFDAVALAWNPVEVATIARQTRLPSNQVSAQLRSLVKSGHLTEAVSNPKRKSYMLADRFSNVHYLMRHGRAMRVRFDWFVVMVRLLFEDKDFATNIATLAKQSAATCREGWLEAHDLVANAVHRAESDEARRHLLDQLAEGRNSDSVIDLCLAETACRNALEDDPNDAHAHYKLGRVLELFHDTPESAAAEYRTATKLDPTHAEAWAALGWVCHRGLGRTKEAETAYRRALELKPDAYWVWTNYGNFLQEKTKRFDEAEAAYRRTIELDPKNTMAWLNLGNLFQDHLERFDEAETAYKKATVLDEVYGPPYMGLARLYHRQGRDPDVFRPLACEAVVLPPPMGFVLGAFMRLCGDDSKSLVEVLPPLCRWCAANRHHLDLPMMHFFVTGMWLRLVWNAGTSRALHLFDSLPTADQQAFEALRDVFLAQEDRSHLHCLAPERAALVTQLLEQLDLPE